MLTLLNMLHLFGLNKTKTRLYTQNIVKRLYNPSNLHVQTSNNSTTKCEDGKPFFTYKKEELQFMKQNHNIKFNPNVKSPNALKKS